LFVDLSRTNAITKPETSRSQSGSIRVASKPRKLGEATSSRANPLTRREKVPSHDTDCFGLAG
jgi:hypothetical protein